MPDTRPDRLRPLLYDLYVREGLDVETTLDHVAALRPVLIADIGRDELKARLLAGEPYLAHTDVPKRVTAPMVVGAARRAQSRLDCQQDLRAPREAVGSALERLDLQDDVPSVGAYETELLDAIRDQLGIDVDDQDGEQDEDGPLGAYRAGVS